MSTAELTINLPIEDASFLKSYAQQHGTTVDQLIASYAKILKGPPQSPLHPDIVKLTGLVPADLDGRDEYRLHLIKKHQ